MSSTCEEICQTICEKLEIGNYAFSLFSLQEINSLTWIPPNATLIDPKIQYTFRLRFLPGIKGADFLRAQEKKAMFYFFLQCRTDFCNDKINIASEGFRHGLALIDCIRVMNLKEFKSATKLFDAYGLKCFLPSSKVRLFIIFIFTVIYYSKLFYIHRLTYRSYNYIVIL